MALEAVQAQAGHTSIESTRIYLHLADDWLASQYRHAAEVIDAQVFAEHPLPPRAAPPAGPVPVPGFRRLR
jgi:integrase/recombinase XerD